MSFACSVAKLRHVATPKIWVATEFALAKEEGLTMLVAVALAARRAAAAALAISSASPLVALSCRGVTVSRFCYKAQLLSITMSLQRAVYADPMVLGAALRLLVT